MCNHIYKARKCFVRLLKKTKRELIMKNFNNYFLTLLFLIFFSTKIYSQNSKIDSLKVELKNHKEKDSVRVNILNGLAFSYFSKDIHKAIQYLDESYIIAEDIQFKKGKGRSIYIWGITEAIQANCYNAIAIVYKNKGELRKSIIYLKKAIEIEEVIKGKNLSAALINLGAVYQELGEFDKALFPLKKSTFYCKNW